MQKPLYPQISSTSAHRSIATVQFSQNDLLCPYDSYMHDPSPQYLSTLP
jgi:hypothetical protein